MSQFGGLQMWRAVRQLVSGMLAVSFVLGWFAGNGVSPATAATPIGPPRLQQINKAPGGAFIVWQFPPTSVPRPDGSRLVIGPDGPWGVQFNVFLEQTGKRVATMSTSAKPALDFNNSQQSARGGQDFFPLGDLDDFRYCITLQLYVKNSTNTAQELSDESNRMCAGTQRVQIITPVEDVTPPPPPPKPDLAIGRVSGPSVVENGDLATYEVVLRNDGDARAESAAMVQIGVLGAFQPVEMELVPGGFTCAPNQYGFMCAGALGGKDDPIQTRVAVFRVQVRIEVTDAATEGVIAASANHDRALDETTFDNNMVLFRAGFR